MSYTFPGQQFAQPGTQPIDLVQLLGNLPEWGKALKLGVAGAPTYRAFNTSAAYFEFMNKQNRDFSDSEANEFILAPDLPKFQDLRKYMIILANVLLKEYCDLNLAARKIDYMTVCDYDGQNDDLKKLIGEWAKEIDSRNNRDLTEIYIKVDGTAYPIAFYSETKMRVYPFNTINRVALQKLLGWDEEKKDFTMEALAKDFNARPTSDRVLYAALYDTNAGLTTINAAKALALWLTRNRAGIRMENGAPYPIQCVEVVIDDQVQSLNLPIPAMPYGLKKHNAFSEQLLIIKSNSNARNHECGLCTIPNASIGIKDASAPEHAIVPPLSDYLIGLIRSQQVEFKGAEVAKNGGDYQATIHLCIQGADCSFTWDYAAGDVRKCDNFPLVSVLKCPNEATIARLYRCDYDPVDRTPASYLDGYEIKLGLAQGHDNNYELQFNVNVTVNQDELYYFGVRYHNSDEGRTYSCGYLFYDMAHSLYNATNASDSTSVLIDDSNNIAQIAVLDTDNNKVSAYNVYNDRIFFFNRNSRNDFDARNGKIWGEPNTTIFEVAGGSMFALAPFSSEFADMVANKQIRLTRADLKQDGHNWEFFVEFEYKRRNMKTKTRVYKPEEQYTSPNPPFLYAVQTVNAQTAKPGYDVIMVQNMRVAGGVSQSGKSNVLDSNDLQFQIGKKSIVSTLFVDQQELDQHNPRTYIKIYGSPSDGKPYYGQISLPLVSYSLLDGFHALKDDSTDCAAVLLVNNMGAGQPKQIITGRVFDDNLFLIARESSRSAYTEYKSWRNSGLFVDVEDMPMEHRDGKEYEAIFPFSLQMLRNLNSGNLQLSQGHRPIVRYDRESKCYRVSIFIEKGNGEQDPFTMSYRESQIVRCDNLPFIVPLKDNENHMHIVRFNNEEQQHLRDHADGTRMIIDCMNGEKAVPVEKEKIVPLDGSNVILRVAAPKENAQCVCHVLYQAAEPFGDGVYSVHSDATGAQHVFDYNAKENRVREITVFTDYIMWTSLFADTFANGTEPVSVSDRGRRDSRIYSIPITMEFSRLMEERGLKIADYSHVKYHTDVNDVDSGITDSNADLYVTISLTGLQGGSSTVQKCFDKSHIVGFGRYPLPTLTVFPFVNFVANHTYGEKLRGKSLWQQYSYAKFTKETETAERDSNARTEALGARVEFWINGKKVEFQKRSTKIMDSMEVNEQTRMEVAKVSGWGHYIHMKYDGSNTVAPTKPVDSQWNGKELGCIIMKPAPTKEVDSTRNATVGVDFGTRNSIVAIYPDGVTAVSFPYHGHQELQKIVIPGMDDVAFKDFSNLSYIPHFDGRADMGVGCGKFASTVMAYSVVEAANEVLTPYDRGFVPNVQGDVLKRIMNRMTRPGSMADLLGFYSDLKISTSADTADPNLIRIMDRNVRLFIKSVMFHTALNCYQAGCGKINVRFSVPSEMFVKNLKPVWLEAQKYIDSYFPEQARGNITVGEYATEAKALFKHLSSNMNGTPPKYSAITDGGDGTYDFTINKLVGNQLTNPNAFSLRYAGQQIMTDSVNAFYDHLVRRNGGQRSEEVKSVFRGLWKSGDGSEAVLETREQLITQLSDYRNIPGGTDREREKTMVLMLVEQFGIDCQKLRNPNARNLMQIVTPEYTNFVRMIQYKFLFLFNVLGEQIRKNIRLEEDDVTSFNIYLYGGTAQALTIAEPLCQGNLAVYGSPGAGNLPMVVFIDAMLDLPRNVNGEKIILKFIPAKDSEKREIASGLIAMQRTELQNFNVDGGQNVEIPSFAGAAPAAQQQEPVEGGFGDFFSGFGNMGGMGFDMNPAPQPTAPGMDTGAERNARKPRTLDGFIDSLKEVLCNRTVELPQGEYSIDNFLPFMDENGQPIYLSRILDDQIVRNAMLSELTTLWNTVCTENSDIDDPDMLYHIYTLKMVGLAIEAYLRK